MFLTRFGGDLLSHVLRRSTIGAVALNCRVRDGIGCFAHAMTTKPRKKHQPCLPQGSTAKGELVCVANLRPFWFLPGTFVPGTISFIQVGTLMCMLLSQSSTGSNQAYRAISTGQLNALLRLHLRPIDVVVYHGSQGYLVLRGASRLDAFSGYPFRS